MTYSFGTVLSPFLHTVDDILLIYSFLSVTPEVKVVVWEIRWQKLAIQHCMPKSQFSLKSVAQKWHALFKYSGLYFLYFSQAYELNYIMAISISQKFSCFRLLTRSWFITSIHWIVRQWILFRACHFCAISFREKPDQSYLDSFLWGSSKEKA